MLGVWVDGFVYVRRVCAGAKITGDGGWDGLFAGKDIVHPDGGTGGVFKTGDP